MSEIIAHSGLFKDTKLHVDDTGGTGRPVLLIHGWPLSGESWKHQVPALQAAGYRVITYDRRGFGRSDKPFGAYTYKTLTDDLASVIDGLELHDLSLVGFSMGGGEVARYVSTHGTDRLHSVVFASAVPPYLMRTPGNPDGPLAPTQAASMAASLTAHSHEFYDGFLTTFFSANDTLVVSEQERQEALRQADQASTEAALACMTAFGNTDFRDDLTKITLPTLVIHGDSDATVPFEGSGKRTHEAIAGSKLHLVVGGPHGCTVSHADEWNSAVVEFLGS